LQLLAEKNEFLSKGYNFLIHKSKKDLIDHIY